MQYTLLPLLLPSLPLPCLPLLSHLELHCTPCLWSFFGPVYLFSLACPAFPAFSYPWPDCNGPVCKILVEGAASLP